MRRIVIALLAVLPVCASCHDRRPMTPAGPIDSKGVAFENTDVSGAPDCAQYPWFWKCFPEQITPIFPGGIDILYFNRTCPDLARGGACSESGLQRLDEMFDVFGWQLFIAVSWPQNAGTPAPDIFGRGAPVWAGWRSTADAEVPLIARACNDIAPGELASYADGDRIPPRSNLAIDRYGRSVIVETRIDALSAEHFASADSWTKQAFQECNKVLSTLDPFREAVWGYIFKDKATSPSSYGQLRGSPESGPTRLKLGYRVLDEQDDPSKFVTRREGDRTLGLVAMHLVTKVVGTDDRWVWATFEHVNAVDGPEAFFTGPGCNKRGNCPPPNRCPLAPARSNAGYVLRERPLSGPVQRLNGEVRARLRDLSSVLQHYQLIGVQWSYPTEPVKTGASKGLRGSQAYAPRPEILSNAVLEWDRQATDCMGCHRNAVTYQLPRAACERDCPDSPEGACPASALGIIRPVFSTGDFFWKYKDVPGVAR